MCCSFLRCEICFEVGRNHFYQLFKLHVHKGAFLKTFPEHRWGLQLHLWQLVKILLKRQSPQASIPLYKGAVIRPYLDSHCNDNV
jgi:hypothetical protein